MACQSISVSVFVSALISLSPLSLEAWLTDTSSCHMMAAAMETRATAEAAGVSVRPVRADLLTPGQG